MALGKRAAGLMTISEEVASIVEQVSRKSLERTWRLPHWHEYEPQFDSDIADCKNITGLVRVAGTVSAMRFLSKFVPRSVKWGHLDVANTAWLVEDWSGQPKGASGWGIRFLNQLMEDLTTDAGSAGRQ